MRVKKALTPILSAALMVLAGCSPGVVEDPGPEPPAERAQATAPAVTNPPTAPAEGICDRRRSVQRSILQELGENDCRNIGLEDLRRVRSLSVHTPGIDRKDLKGLEDLLRLKVTGLMEPLDQDTLWELEELHELVIQAGAADAPATTPILPTGALGRLSQLEYLRITSEEGHVRRDLTPELLSGTGKLRRLEIDYVGRIAPDALGKAPLLEVVKVHGTEAWADFPPRTPSSLFAELPRLRYVELRNFRWPPVLKVHNPEVACQAGDWRSFNNPEDPGRRPLSVLVPGKHNRPKDVTSLKGCDRKEQ